MTATYGVDLHEVEAAVTGAFIAFIGIPGAGKSTVCEHLARLLGVEALLEPEDWPAAVRERDVSGAFTALSWFRSMRVPNLYRAAAQRDQGLVSIVDSYYDKLCSAYLEADEMAWLLPPEDPWHRIATSLAALDWERLPNADCVVVFEVDEPTWHRFLTARGRDLDDAFGLSDQFACQPLFARAAERYAAESGARIVRFRQGFDSPAAAAERLRRQLIDAGVVNGETCPVEP